MIAETSRHIDGVVASGWTTLLILRNECALKLRRTQMPHVPPDSNLTRTVKVDCKRLRK